MEVFLVYKVVESAFLRGETRVILALGFVHGVGVVPVGVELKILYVYILKCGIVDEKWYFISIFVNCIQTLINLNVHVIILNAFIDRFVSHILLR